jgi:hypothetical protein
MRTTVTLSLVLALAAMGIAADLSQAQSRPAATTTAPAAGMPAGLRIFTVGHSFHANWLPAWLADVAKSAGVAGHEQIGASMIGGSRVIQHWNLPDDKNQAKTALKTGKVDVLTLSPMLSPDEGIVNFVKLALENNPNTRITVQEFWLPFDRLDCFGEKSYGDLARTLRNWADPVADSNDPNKARYETLHFDVPTAEQIHKLHAPYFKAMDEYVTKLNKDLGKQSVFVVPVGQAVNALREKIIAGAAPGIAKQSELFSDKLGHPKAAIQALSAYCHFAVIYGRSPVGLPMPSLLAKAKADEKLNRLLQELAWDAVTHHPLSGVK